MTFLMYTLAEKKTQIHFFMQIEGELSAKHPNPFSYVFCFGMTKAHVSCGK